MKREFKAILFDFDGTLAKTMEDNFRAWQAAAADYGLAIQPSDYYPLEGLPVPEVPKELFRRYGRQIDNVAEIVEKKERFYRKNHHFEFYPGVESLLGALSSKRVPMGLVTAGLLERLKFSTPPGFLNCFDALVTCEDTLVGKPSPAPYLKGAQKLNVKSECCIVVENAPLGIRAAKGAGCYCIALCTTLPSDELKAADEIVPTFEALESSSSIQWLLKR